MEVIYRVISKKAQGFQTEFFGSKEELFSKYRSVGVNKRTSTREELQGQPLLDGVLGPMYDGVLDGKVVIRYEDQAVYDLLSS